MKDSRRDFIKKSAMGAGGFAIGANNLIPAEKNQPESRNLLDQVFKKLSDLGNENCHIWSPETSLKPFCRLALSQEDVDFIIESNNIAGCHGGWEIVCEDIIPKKSYCFKATAIMEGIPNPVENISAEIYFFSGNPSKPVDWSFVEVKSLNNSEVFFFQSFVIPENTDLLVIRLLLRWTATGSVRFSRLSLSESKIKTPVKMNLAVGSGWKPGDTLQKNLNICMEVIRKAAKKGADYILLPEVILSSGVPGSSVEHARPIPGFETDQIAACARENKIGVALTMNEANGTLVHNTGLIFDKQDNIVLKYRKVHLAVGERWSGTTPGNQYPFTDVPGGRMGMQICYDNVHPEGIRALALQGVQIVLLPIMGDPRSWSFDKTDKNKLKWDEDKWYKIMSMRALDNHVWFVVAANDGRGSCIINPAGEIITSKSSGDEILFAEVDSSYRNMTSKIGSSHYNRYWRERRPSTYSALNDTNFRTEPFLVT